MASEPIERLTRDRIVEAALTLAERDGPGALTMRGLGAQLGVDPTATYRHFNDKDELIRALGDRVLGEALDNYQTGEDWATNLRSLCQLLYRAFCARPRLTRLLTESPPRGPNELNITELILRQLDAAGFRGRQRALAYHALVELTVGIAVIDSESAISVDGPDALYERWRASYRSQPTKSFPTIASTVEDLYLDDEEQFVYTLDLVLAGLDQRARCANGGTNSL